MRHPRGSRHRPDSGNDERLSKERVVAVGRGKGDGRERRTVSLEPTRVLVVEDSREIAALITMTFETDGMEVDHVADLAGARKRLSEEPPDVVVLDIELPDGCGLDLLRDRGATGDVPVVILSGRRAEMDRVRGLELGAEDYVVKPFFPRELATRVRRAAERSSSPSVSRLVFGGVVIDLAAREALVDGTVVPLTAREFDLLTHLASSPRTVFSRDDLLREVWNSCSEWQSTSTVTEHVRRLRQKIEPDPKHPRRIVTVGGAGYRFEPDAPGSFGRAPR